MKSMKKALAIVLVLTMILALVFLVFLVLDQFNPLMNFIDNPVSRVLLALFCVCGAAQTVCHWRSRRPARSVPET